MLSTLDELLFLISRNSKCKVTKVKVDLSHLLFGKNEINHTLIIEENDSEEKPLKKILKQQFKAKDYIPIFLF